MINNEQKQLMISALLGDASVSRNKFSFNCMYEEYMKYKSKLSGDLSLGVKEKSNMGYKKGSKIFEFHMSPNDYSKYLRSIPLKEALKEADELALALWFMDDGSLHKKNYFYNINTHAFSKQEQEDILIPLLNRFNIYPEILPENKSDGRQFHYLYVSKWKGGMEMSRIIRKYVVDCYKYKLIPKEIEDAYFKLDLNEFRKIESPYKQTCYFLKQNGVKYMRDMISNNILGNEYTHSELKNMWYEKFPNTSIVFAMYKIGNKDSEKIIPEINFRDENPIVKGSFKLSMNTWKYGDTLYKLEGRTLTWEKLINILDEHNDGHHIFLESIDIKNNNEVSIFLGS